MSVTILGMSMPANCSECRLMVGGWCYAVGLDQREPIDLEKRPGWCPLVEAKFLTIDTICADDIIKGAIDGKDR